MGNLSGVDRVMHIIVGVLIAIFALMYGGTLGSVVILIVGILAVLFGIFGWSGVYSIFGISTKKSAHSKISGNDIKKAVKGHMEAKAEASSSTNPTTAKKKASPKKTTTAKKTVKKATAGKTTATKKAPAKKTVAKKTITTKKSKK